MEVENLEDIPLIWDVSFGGEDDALLFGLEKTYGNVQEGGENGDFMEKEGDTNNNRNFSSSFDRFRPTKKRKVTFLIDGDNQSHLYTPVSGKNYRGSKSTQLNGNFRDDNWSTPKSILGNRSGMPKLDPSYEEPDSGWTIRLESSIYDFRHDSGPPALSPEAPVQFSGLSPKKEDPSVLGTEDDAMTDLVEYYYAQTEKIILEGYYFGESPGETIRTPDFYQFFKCPVCAKCFNSNSEIYGHLHSHADGRGKRASVLSSCPYCLEPVSAAQLKYHMNTVHHIVREHRYCCQICEVYFPEECDLALHMWKNHCRLDMPYRCAVCDYRSSIRFNVIDHFHKMHVPGPFVLCPICLKVFPAASEHDVNEIWAHAQLHEVVEGQKCKHCALVYTGKNELNLHYRSGAHSCKQWENEKREILPYKNLFQIRRLKIPKPPESLENAIMGLKIKKNRKYERMCDPAFNLNLNVEEETCLECGDELNAVAHFPGVMTCTKCSYITCCIGAMTKHYERMHRHKNRKYQGLPRLQNRSCCSLEKSLRCECGYQSWHPNRLARHLVSCNKTSAYL